eukprot:symbB.v1.2.019083.t1/scaffold1547.1/size112433/4
MPSAQETPQWHAQAATTQAAMQQAAAQQTAMTQAAMQQAAAQQAMMQAIIPPVPQGHPAFRQMQGDIEQAEGAAPAPSRRSRNVSVRLPQVPPPRMSQRIKAPATKMKVAKKAGNMGQHGSTRCSITNTLRAFVLLGLTAPSTKQTAQQYAVPLAPCTWS